MFCVYNQPEIDYTVYSYFIIIIRRRRKVLSYYNIAITVSSSRVFCCIMLDVVVPYVSICIDSSLYRSGILKVLELVRPQWKCDTVKFKEFEGGLTNKIVCVKCGEEDVLLVRVYGRNTERFINRESEIKNLVFLNKHIGTPPVYAHFDNGLCYGYAKGRQLDLFELHDKAMGRRVARQMARMHTVPLPVEDQKQPLLFSTFLNTWLDKIPNCLETETRTARYGMVFVRCGMVCAKCGICVVCHVWYYAVVQLIL